MPRFTQEFAVARPELGTKHTCTSCGTRFYDLNRSPFVCPKCGQAFTESPSSTLIAVATPAPAKPAPPAAKLKVNSFDDEDESGSEDEVLADVEIEEIDDEEDDAAADTFLEEDDDGDDDVTGIIGGIGDKDET